MPTASEIFAREAEPDLEDREGTPFNALGEREYTVSFLVEVKIKTTNELVICNCPGLPLPWSPHPADLAALCVKLRAKRRVKGEWRFWTVTANYSTKMPEGGPQIGKVAEGDNGGNSRSPSNNPELEPPDIEWDFETATRAPEFDLTGKDFVNSAMQPYTPARTIEYADSVLMISRNENDFNRDLAAKYSYSVNKEKFLGARDGSVLCLPPKAKLMNRGPISYYRVSYRLKFGELLPGGAHRRWTPLEILDAGLMQIKQQAGEPGKFILVPCLTGGVPASQPMALDGKGKQLHPRIVVGVNGEPDKFVLDKVYNKFNIRRKTDFTALLRNGLGRKL